LAAEIGISPKTLRDFLRKTYPPEQRQKNDRWILTDGQIEAVRKKWSQKA
jgi:predicted site-specific integrase-resolvase